MKPLDTIPVSCRTDAACEARLREALECSGSRYTRQRAAVYSYLRSVESHPTAEDVFQSVRRDVPHISLATVYKALDALVGANLALKLGDGDGPARYDARTQAHYHCRCTQSGRVYDVPASFDPQLLDKLDPALVALLKERGFRVTDYRLEILGVAEVPAVG